jgi:F-type H+-transporting ATPase subunit delta
MRELLAGYGLATLESAAAAGRLPATRDGLAEADRVLLDSTSLREVMVDRSVPAEARRGIWRDLLEDRATPEALALVIAVVRLEWPGELPRALFELLERCETAISALGPATAGASASGAVARALVEQAQGGGREVARARLEGYTERVFEELADVAELDEVEDECFSFARVVGATPALRRALADPDRSGDELVAIVAQLLEGRVRPATLRLVTAMVRIGRVRDPVGTLDWLVEVAAAERGRRVAEVRSAVELDEPERARLSATLSRTAGRPVELRVVLDQTVLGGVQILLGDLVIDGTLRRRFEQLRAELVASGA